MNKKSLKICQRRRLKKDFFLRKQIDQGIFLKFLTHPVPKRIVEIIGHSRIERKCGKGMMEIFGKKKKEGWS